MQLRALHLGSSEGNIANCPSEWTSFSRFFRQLVKAKLLHTTKILPILCDMEALLVSLQAEFQNTCGGDKRVLCHLDLHCQNIMRNRKGELQFIDFGMAGFDHPYCDLAYVTMYHALGPLDQLRLLSLYSKVQVTPTLWSKFLMFRILPYYSKMLHPIIRATREWTCERESVADAMMRLRRSPQSHDFSYYIERLYSGQKRSPMEWLEYADCAWRRVRQLEIEWRDAVAALASKSSSRSLLVKGEGVKPFPVQLERCSTTELGKRTALNLMLP